MLAGETVRAWIFFGGVRLWFRDIDFTRKSGYLDKGHDPVPYFHMEKIFFTTEGTEYTEAVKISLTLWALCSLW